MKAKQYTESNITESNIEQEPNFEPVLPVQPLAVQPAAPQLQSLPYVDEEGDEESAPKPKKAKIIPPLIGILLRKSWLIAIPTIAAGAAGFIFIPKSPIEFKGSFRLLVEPLSSEEQKAQPGALAGTGISQGLDYITQIEILKSPGMLSEVIKQIQKEYPVEEYELKSKLSIWQVDVGGFKGQTKLIEVFYQSETQKQTMFVLEKLANKYLQYSLNERKTRINSGVGFIDEQIPELEEQVNGLQDRLQVLQQKYNLTDIGVLAEELASQRSKLKGQKFQTEQELSQQKALYANLQRMVGLTTNEAMAALALTERIRYQELLTRLQQIEAQIATESVRFKEDNPVIQVLREEQQNISELLRQEAEVTLGERLSNIEDNPQVMSFQNDSRQARIVQLVDTLTQINILEVRKRVLEQEEQLLFQQTREFPAIARQYQELQNQLQIAQNNLYRLLENREKLRIEAAQKEVPWELVAKPDLIRHPITGEIMPVYGESRKKLLLMAAIAGLGLGAGAALLIDISRNIFFTSEDIADLIPFPFLGVIPRDGGMKTLALSSDEDSSIKLTHSAEESELAGQSVRGCSDDPEFLESFSLLFAKIRFLAADLPIRSLTISSAQVGDGKSIIALHLAQTAALMGQRVLLVDANLRRPALHRMLDIPNVKGLGELLTDKVSPQEMISRSPLADRLSVLTSGVPRPDAAKLLAAPRMRYLMEELESMFDLVIYDSAHLHNLVDTNFLASHTDGILMVVAPNKTKRSAVTQVLNDLTNFNLEVLGTVANCFK